MPVACVIDVEVGHMATKSVISDDVLSVVTVIQVITTVLFVPTSFLHVLIETLSWKVIRVSTVAQSSIWAFIN